MELKFHKKEYNNQGWKCLSMWHQRAYITTMFAGCYHCMLGCIYLYQSDRNRGVAMQRYKLLCLIISKGFISIQDRLWLFPIFHKLKVQYTTWTHQQQKLLFYIKEPYIYKIPV